VDADADDSNVLKAVVVTGVGFSRVGEEFVLIVRLHVALAVTDVGRWGRWRLVHILLSIRVGGKVDRLREAGRGNDIGHPGPLRALVEVLDANVPPESLRAQAEVMEDGLVLPGHQTAQAAGRISTTVVEGNDGGRVGPLMSQTV